MNGLLLHSVADTIVAQRRRAGRYESARQAARRPTIQQPSAVSTDVVGGADSDSVATVGARAQQGVQEVVSDVVVARAAKH